MGPGIRSTADGPEFGRERSTRAGGPAPARHAARGPALGTLRLTVATFAIILDFDPLLRVGDLSLQIATLVLAAVVAEAILLAARIAASTPAVGGGPRSFVRGSSLRLDDLLFIVLGVVPGAVLGGRLDHVLANLAFYSANPDAILDPSRGGLGLGLAVVGGVLTGAVVVRLLEASVGRWAHAAALPMLFAIAGGRLVQAISGSGQGAPSDAPWATSYVGPGPWGSLGPAIASHPSQVYEGALTLVVLVVVGALVAGGAFARRDGQALALAIGLWAAVRAVAASTWRDDSVLAGLNAGQLIAIVVALGCGVALVLRRRVRNEARHTGPAVEGAPSGVTWPDPAERPRF